MRGKSKKKILKKAIFLKEFCLFLNSFIPKAKRLMANV